MPTSVSVAGQTTLWGRKSTNWPETRKCCSWKESRSVHWSLITTNHHFFSLLLIILWLPLTFRSVMTFLIRPKKYRNWSVRSGAVTPNWIMLPTAWTSSTRDLDTSSAGTWWVPYQTWLLSESLHCPLKHFNFNPFFSLSAAPPSATHQPHAGELRPGKNRSWSSLSESAHSQKPHTDHDTIFFHNTPCLLIYVAILYSQNLELQHKHLMIVEEKLSKNAHILGVEQKCQSLLQTFQPAHDTVVVLANKAKLHKTTSSSSCRECFQ